MPLALFARVLGGRRSAPGEIIREDMEEKGLMSVEELMVPSVLNRRPFASRDHYFLLRSHPVAIGYRLDMLFTSLYMQMRGVYKDSLGHLPLPHSSITSSAVYEDSVAWSRSLLSWLVLGCPVASFFLQRRRRIGNAL